MLCWRLELKLAWASGRRAQSDGMWTPSSVVSRTTRSVARTRVVILSRQEVEVEAAALESGSSERRQVVRRLIQDADYGNRSGSQGRQVGG